MAYIALADNPVMRGQEIGAESQTRLENAKREQATSLLIEAARQQQAAEEAAARGYPRETVQALHDNAYMLRAPFVTLNAVGDTVATPGRYFAPVSPQYEREAAINQLIADYHNQNLQYDPATGQGSVAVNNNYGGGQVPQYLSDLGSLRQEEMYINRVLPSIAPTQPQYATYTARLNAIRSQWQTLMQQIRDAANAGNVDEMIGNFYQNGVDFRARPPRMQ